MKSYDTMTGPKTKRRRIAHQHCAFAVDVYSARVYLRQLEAALAGLVPHELARVARVRAWKGRVERVKVCVVHDEGHDADRDCAPTDPHQRQQ